MFIINEVPQLEKAAAATARFFVCQNYGLSVDEKRVQAVAKDALPVPVFRWIIRSRMENIEDLIHMFE